MLQTVTCCDSVPLADGCLSLHCFTSRHQFQSKKLQFAVNVSLECSRGGVCTWRKHLEDASWEAVKLPGQGGSLSKPGLAYCKLIWGMGIVEDLTAELFNADWKHEQAFRRSHADRLRFHRHGNGFCLLLGARGCW